MPDLDPELSHPGETVTGDDVKFPAPEEMKSASVREEPDQTPPECHQQHDKMHAVDSPSNSSGYAEGDADIGSDGDSGVLIRYCKNCTARLLPMQPDVCINCSWHVDDDEMLLGIDFEALKADACSPWSVPSPESPVIAWDHRMEFHEEIRRGSPHPERPDRVKAAIARAIASGAADRCQRLPVREATREELEACHSVSLIDSVFDTARSPRYFTSDTYSNESTASSARLAAGACVDVAVAVAKGIAPSGAAICRPPGHHAESSMAMGFCFFNNAAVAARAAQKAGARKVLILDWDVHHGNGTQHIFEGDSSVLYMSIHRHDGGTFFPGTGAASEVGYGSGAGFTVNIPWGSGGAGDGDYISAMHQVVLPIAYEFAPDMIIVSAGFDAARGDPIGGCLVSPNTYGHMTSMLKTVAPVAVLLEGGYNLSATAMGVESVLRVLLGERPAPFDCPPVMSHVSRSVIPLVQMIHSRHWSSMGMAGVFDSIVQGSTGGIGRVGAGSGLGFSINSEPEHSDDEAQALDQQHVPDTDLLCTAPCQFQDSDEQCFLGRNSENSDDPCSPSFIKMQLGAEGHSDDASGADGILGVSPGKHGAAVLGLDGDCESCPKDLESGSAKKAIGDLSASVAFDPTPDVVSRAVECLATTPLGSLPGACSPLPVRSGSYHRWQYVRQLQFNAMRSLQKKRKAAVATDFAAKGDLKASRTKLSPVSFLDKE